VDLSEAPPCRSRLGGKTSKTHSPFMILTLPSSCRDYCRGSLRSAVPFHTIGGPRDFSQLVSDRFGREEISAARIDIAAIHHHSQEPFTRCVKWSALPTPPRSPSLHPPSFVPSSQFFKPPLIPTLLIKSSLSIRDCSWN
jgi:hypothetical protein